MAANGFDDVVGEEFAEEGGEVRELVVAVERAERGVKFDVSLGVVGA